MPQIVLEAFNLEAAERRLCVETLALTGTIVGAAQLLGITRHALKRRIVKLGLSWSRTNHLSASTPAFASASAPASASPAV